MILTPSPRRASQWKTTPGWARPSTRASSRSTGGSPRAQRIRRCWKAISADPDGEHLPHTPSERFIDGYCTAIRKARQAGARVAMTSLPPLEQSRYFSFITKGLSAENILRWLGDTDHLYRWQEYYNDMVTQLSRAFGCRLVDLRAEFLKSRVFPSLIGADGIHPTQAGHDLIHQSVQTALSY